MAQAATDKRICAELDQRIEAIRQRAPRARPGEIASDLQAIRRIARANGMIPAVTVLQALDSALARGEHGALVDGWLSILRDAVGCDRRDAGTQAVFAAACSVRFG
jgi:uncharacterized protein (DUF2267 family)